MLLLTELELRLIIRKQLLKEGVAWKKGGLGSKSSQSGGSSSSDSSGNSKGEEYNSGKYPADAVEAVKKAMDEKGITNQFLRVGILCTIAKESNFKPSSEKTYDNTGLNRIYEIWPKLKKLGDSEVEKLKKSTSPSDGHKQAGLGLFDYLYGGKYGNGPKESGDGSRYRGRGFNQVTFKSSYEKYGKLAGIDLVGKPDQLNDIGVAAKVAIAFLANRIKSDKGTVNPDLKSYEEGIKVAAEANCKAPGANKDCSRAIRTATERLKDFVK